MSRPCDIVLWELAAIPRCLLDPVDRAYIGRELEAQRAMLWLLPFRGSTVLVLRQSTVVRS